MVSPIQIWIKGGDTIVALFPPVPGSMAEHTVEFPANGKGMALLLATLRARTSDSRIGEIGEPTRYQAERALVESKKYREWMKAMAESRQLSFDEALEKL